MEFGPQRRDRKGFGEADMLWSGKLMWTTDTCEVNVSSLLYLSGRWCIWFNAWSRPWDLMWKALPCSTLSTGFNGKKVFVRALIVLCSAPPQIPWSMRNLWTAVPLELGKPHRPHPSSFHCLDLQGQSVGLQPAFPWLWDSARLQFLFVLIRKETNHRAYFVSYKGSFSEKTNGIFLMKSQGELGVYMTYVKCYSVLCLLRVSKLGMWSRYRHTLAMVAPTY